MCHSDTIADFLTRVRNATRAGHRYTDVRWSKVVEQIAETLKEVRRALLDADVNFKIAKQFTDTVKNMALGQEVPVELDLTQVSRI